MCLTLRGTTADLEHINYLGIQSFITVVRENLLIPSQGLKQTYMDCKQVHCMYTSVHQVLIL
jgi:hypothetical protein